MDKEFKKALETIQALHDRKSADYGTTDDPYANICASEELGVKPWIGALLRANDKMARLKKAASGKELMNEGIEDSLLDLATYAIIAYVLLSRTPPKVPVPVPAPVPDGKIVMEYIIKND